MLVSTDQRYTTIFQFLLLLFFAYVLFLNCIHCSEQPSPSQAQRTDLRPGMRRGPPHRLELLEDMGRELHVLRAVSPMRGKVQGSRPMRRVPAVLLPRERCRRLVHFGLWLFLQWARTGQKCVLLSRRRIAIDVCRSRCRCNRFGRYNHSVLV